MFPKRRSIRLPGYDYSQLGEYFITINTDHFRSIFGSIDGERVRLSSFGQIAREEWLNNAKLRTNIELGPFIIMPNHIHGIISIIEETTIRAQHAIVQAQHAVPVHLGK